MLHGRADSPCLTLSNLCPVPFFKFQTVGYIFATEFIGPVGCAQLVQLMLGKALVFGVENGSRVHLLLSLD